MSEPYAAADGLVRVYPASMPADVATAHPTPALVWAHGGGFVAGDLDMPEADWVARSLAARGVTVVSIDYRLASDGWRYPTPSNDVLAAWTWTLANTADLGIDPARVSLGGASAGANLVAGAVLRLLGNAGRVASAGERIETTPAGLDTVAARPTRPTLPAGLDTVAARPTRPTLPAGLDTVAARPTRPTLPAGVLLAYPTLLAVQPEPDAALRAALDATPAADRFGSDAVRGMYERYLGGPVDDAPLVAVPGRAAASDLAGFPPVLMINGEVDELRVSGELFAAALVDAGVTVDLVVEPGTEHGHLNRPGEPAASASIERIARWITWLDTYHQTTLRITEGITS